ncbi:MAG: hypothetical protein GWP91_25645 [Rhodobacterales bacterium]|nr:hypothetical protein [Rhodobacterales bacterium]
MKNTDANKAARAEQRQAKVQALNEKRDQMRQKLEQRRETVKKDSNKTGQSRWLVPLLLLIIGVLLFRDCTREAPPEAVQIPDCPPAECLGEPTEPSPSRFTGRNVRQDRPVFDTPSTKPPPWIASFRMQVAARSPRLAECFVGTVTPGRLKWTSSVEPHDGHVSDHLLEPVLTSADLTRQERECVLDVLADPAYRLEVGEERATPSRVGIVIEF